MANSTVSLNASIDSAWSQLQQLATWDGVAGMEELAEPEHDSNGDLRSFAFAITTSLGRVKGRAQVQGAKPAMTISSEQKGLLITIDLLLREADTGSLAQITATSKATSFLTKPLQVALNALLDTALDGEAAQIGERIQPG